MSQEKVDEKKKLKKNRKKIVKREHRNAKIAAVIAIAAAVFVAGWLVYSIHGRVVAYHEAHPKTVTVNLTDLFGFSVDDSSSSSTSTAQ